MKRFRISDFGFWMAGITPDLTSAPPCLAERAERGRSGFRVRFAARRIRTFLGRPSGFCVRSGERASIQNPKSKIQNRSGFTLIETALATIIVGVGVLSIVAAQQAFHKQNEWSSHAALAQRLGNEIREMTFTLPRHDPVTGTAYWGAEPNELIGSAPILELLNDVDDFDGAVFSAALDNGPINSMRQVIPNMNGWAQSISVEKVNPFNINVAAAANEPYLLKVMVSVSFQGVYDNAPYEVTQVSWVAPN